MVDTKKMKEKTPEEGFPLPLPLYEQIDLDPIEGKEERFVVSVGLDRDLVAQLKVRALDMNDMALQQGTSDYKRFGTGSYEAWYAKGRTPFALTSGDGKLAALIWFGPEAFPADVDYRPASDNWDTIAFRSYEPYRGTGLMRPFGSLVLAFFEKHRQGRKLWLETNVDNTAGVRLYEKLGFIARGVRKSSGRMLMTRE